MRAAEKFGNRPVSVEMRLAKVIIDEVRFEKVGVSEALAFVRKKVAESTKQAFTANVVLKKPSDAKVCLVLHGVPATELLRYFPGTKSTTFHMRRC